jgi:hypothetical protein
MPDTTKKARCYIYLPADVARALRMEAAERHRTMSEIVEEALLTRIRFTITDGGNSSR